MRLLRTRELRIRQDRQETRRRQFKLQVMHSDLPDQHELYAPSARAQSPFLTSTSDLTQAVDVYADWIDACDAVAKETAATEAAARPIQPHPSSSRAIPEDKGTEEDDGFIDDADADPEEDFADD